MRDYVTVGNTRQALLDAICNQERKLQQMLEATELRGKIQERIRVMGILGRHITNSEDAQGEAILSKIMEIMKAVMEE